MFSTRFFHILILALAIGYVAHASVPIPGRLAYRALAERQAGGEDPDPNSSGDPTSLPPPPTSTPNTEEEEQTSAPPESTTTTSSSAPPAETTSAPADNGNSSEEPSSGAAPQTSSTPTRTNSGGAPTGTSTSQGPRPTSGNGANGDEETSSTSHSVVVSTSFHVFTTTLEDGTRQTRTSATEVTTTPGLNGDDDEDGESGMSTTTRNTIIGVVVGVGGAIILGALGVVFWRLRGRKRQAEEADGLMAYDSTYGNNDKPERGTSPTTTATSQPRNPFQSTLENYHQPTPVNPSSNF